MSKCIVYYKTFDIFFETDEEKFRRRVDDINRYLMTGQDTSVSIRDVITEHCELTPDWGWNVERSGLIEFEFRPLSTPISLNNRPVVELIFERDPYMHYYLY